MKRKKNVIIIMVAVILTVATLGISIWLITVDVMSRKYNLIKLNGKGVPDAVQAEPVEYDIQLSEVKLHYAVYGSGYPLILLHGNRSDHTKLEDAAKYLANDYTVYAIDSRCHGKSQVTEQISYDLMAKDVYEFVTDLGLEKPYLIGHSDGGITALAIAINYPQLLGGFISCGANSTQKAFKSYFTTAVKISYNKGHSILDAMMLEQPQFTKQQLESIITPAFIVAGEFDIMKLSDTAYIAQCIPNSRVAIVKWGGHSYVRNGAKAYQLAKMFFAEGV